MAYSIELADRIRHTFRRRRTISEREMFGGLAFMLSGKMCVGIISEDLVVRLDPVHEDKALDRPHTRPMDFTGRPMKGYIFVAPAGLKDDKDLKLWIDQATTYVKTLPAKKKVTEASP